MNQKKTGIVIQARMKSVRLPGKVMLPFFRDQCILDIILEEIRRGKSQLPIVLATSSDVEDDVIAHWAEANNIHVFRGSESNVLSRFIGAAEMLNFESVIRVCADNPFLSVSLLDDLVEYADSNQCDYVSHQAAPDVPAMKSHIGIFSEWIQVDALRKAAELTSDPLYTEHVTNFVYGHPDIFNVAWLKAPESVFGLTTVRFTIDTPQDFALMSRLYSILAERGIHPNFKDALELVNSDAEAREIMISQIASFKK